MRISSFFAKIDLWFSISVPHHFHFSLSISISLLIPPAITNSFLTSYPFSFSDFIFFVFYHSQSSFSFTTSYPLPHSTLNCFSLILLDFSFSHFPVNSFSMNSCSHLLYLSHFFSVFNSLLFIFILFLSLPHNCNYFFASPLSLFHFYSCFLLLSSSPSYSSSALCHWYSPAAKIRGKFQSSVSIYNTHK